jgi:hypothetical protein
MVGLYKFGTVRELSKAVDGTFFIDAPAEVYREALRIVTVLDGVYGADRDVDGGDGGFVLIAQNIQDLALINQTYMRMDEGTHEAVGLVKCEDEPYVNVLYLSNNEFGVNILMPVSIAPRTLLDDLKEARRGK